MSDPRPEGGSELERRLGYRFRRSELLARAMTHRSLRVRQPDGDNERLEFLGDAVLDLVVSERLFRDFPESREGDLSRKRAFLVSTNTLAEMANQVGLGAELRLGKGEEATGGRTKPSILADGLEAVLGAIYLDGGLGAVTGVITALLAGPYGQLAEGEALADYKTRLQELCQERHRKAPTYHSVHESGPDHDKTFEVEVRLHKAVLGWGTGKSKKEAEQMAAWVALLDLEGEEAGDGDDAEQVDDG